MSRDRSVPGHDERLDEGARAADRDRFGDGPEPVDDRDGRDHREMDDPGDWDDDYAVTGPVEAHGRALDFGLLLFRLACLPMLLHGIHKAADMPGFTAVVADNVVGSQAPDFLAWAVMLGQVALPLLIVVGLFTRPAAFLLAGMMVAIWVLMVFLRPAFVPLDANGALTGEPAVLYAVLALPLVFTGAGRLSVDSLRTGGRP